MRKYLLFLFMLAVGLNYPAIAQNWSALGKGINYIPPQQINYLDFFNYGDGFNDGYDGPVTGNTLAALCFYNGALYAAGFFAEAGDSVVNNIARWDGLKWHPLDEGVLTIGGNGLDAWVNQMIVYNNELYVAGRFLNAGELAVNNIAKWNGSSWSAVGNGLGSYGDEVSSLAIYNGELYAGGRFAITGNIPVNNIARWNGTSWSAVGSGIDVRMDFFPYGSVYTLQVHNGQLFAAGDFYAAGGTSVKNIAGWNGTNWYNLGTGIDTAIHSLASFQGNLYAGGKFNGIKKWDGQNWNGLSNSVSGEVYAMLNYNDTLLAAGRFKMAASDTVNNIAGWDGTTWTGLGNGTDSSITALSADDSGIFAGGNFTTAGKVICSHIAKWSFNCITVPGMPGLINGWGNVCKKRYADFYVHPVIGATDFTWTLPAGWTGNSNGNIIRVLAGENGGTISVKANNSCGSSNVQQTFISTFDPVPGILEPIQGDSVICPNTNQLYSVNPVLTAQKYFWIIPIGWTGSSNLNNISVGAGTNSGYISVRAVNYCSYSETSILKVTVKGSPQSVSAITGNQQVYPGNIQSYSVDSVYGASSYTWSLNGGGVITSGQGSRSVMVNWQSTGTYQLTVSVTTDCNNMVTQNLAINVSTTTAVTQTGSDSFGIQLMPNPSAGLFFIKATGVQHKPVVLEVINMKGQLLYKSGTYYPVTNPFVQQVTLPPVQAGIYILNLRVAGKVFRKSLIILKQ